MKVYLQRRLQKRIIERLIELHRLNLGRVDVEARDNRQAIYLLQGAAITSAISVGKLDSEAGVQGREWRYLIEVTYVIPFFDELPPDDRRIKAWFDKGGYPERPTKSGKPDTSFREQQSGLDQSIIERYDQLFEEVTGNLSQFAHPTYKSTMGNVATKSLRFDYWQQEAHNNPASLTALRGIFVAEALNAILLARNTFPLDHEHIQELLDYKSRLETDFTQYLDPDR